MDQVQPTITLADEPRIPDQYQNTVRDFLRQYWNGRRWEFQESFGFHNLAILTDDQLFHLMVTDTLAEIARAASGEIPYSEEVAGIVYEGIQSLMEALFCPPGLLTSYQIPVEFWDTPLGQMAARAMLWIQGDELITLKEAAELRGVSIPAISQAVKDGRLTRYTDPNSTGKRQGRTLVSRKEVEKM